MEVYMKNDIDKSNAVTTQKFIESVKNFSVGVTTSNTPRQKINLLAVKYADGSEGAFQIAGKSHAFLNTGFLVDGGKIWIFYSADGNIVLTARFNKRRL